MEPRFEIVPGSDEFVPFSQLPREELEYIANPVNIVNPAPGADDALDVDFARRYAAYLLQNQSPG